VQKAEQAYDDAQDLLTAGDTDGAFEEMSNADHVLQEAEALDPKWTLPITRRGWYEYRLARFYGANPTPQEIPTQAALEHAERALALNPNDADALELRGTVKYWRLLIHLVDQGQEQTVRDEAEADLLAAVDKHRRPAAALASLSHLLLNIGDITGAKLKAVSSYEADPFLSNANVTLWRLASSSWDLGTAPEAEKWCKEGQERFPEDYRFQQCAVMLYALKDVPPNVPAAWEAMHKYVELSPTPLKPLTEKSGLQYMAMALVRANELDSAKAVALRGRAAPDVDPLAESARLEAVARFFLARKYEELSQQDAATEQWEEGIKQLGVYLAANPGLMQGYQNEARKGRIDNWYLDGLLNQPRFKALVGVR
jgi:tetratricopeptide (TPR) repeat protein